MLIQASKVESCPEREKYIIILLDEMHIREDLVFDKHTGALIGYTHLGDINDHLMQFEQSLSHSSIPATPKLAKIMMVFMVRGLFNKLQFPYAQFPCADLSKKTSMNPLRNVHVKVAQENTLDSTNTLYSCLCHNIIAFY